MGLLNKLYDKKCQFKEPVVCDIQLMPDKMTVKQWCKIFSTHGVMVTDSSKRRNNKKHNQ